MLREWEFVDEEDCLGGRDAALVLRDCAGGGSRDGRLSFVGAVVGSGGFGGIPFVVEAVGWRRGVAGAVVESPDAAFECVREGRRCCGWAVICLSAMEGDVSGPVDPVLEPSATGLRRALVRSLTGAWREEFIDACETDRPSCADSKDAPSDPFI